MMKIVISCLLKLELAITSCKETVSLCVCALTHSNQARILGTAVYGALICVTAFGGAAVGIIVGAIKGQTTETGFFRGAGIGFMAGSITAIHLLENMVAGQSFSKADLLGSIVDGKAFMEWVTPAILKAYQWQISTSEYSLGEFPVDIYDATGDGVQGLSQHCINKLPACKIELSSNMESSNGWCCSICLRDLQDGDSARKLRSCDHLFHLDCIDEWLTRNGSCPMCRAYVCNESQ